MKRVGSIGLIAAILGSLASAPDVSGFNHKRGVCVRGEVSHPPSCLPINPCPVPYYPQGVCPSPSFSPLVLSPNPRAREGSGKATLRVTLPPDAKLLFNGTPSEGSGGVRTFFTKPLQSGQEYGYELTAEVVEKGSPRRVTERVVLRAGEETKVTLSLPKPDPEKPDDKISPDQKTRVASKVHVVLIADTTDQRLSRGIKVGVNRMKSILEKQIQSSYLVIHLVTPEKDGLPDPDGFPDKKAVLDRITAIGDLTGQSLLCYYMGHGAVDQNNQHYLELYGTRFQSPDKPLIQRPLYRKDILATMRSTKAQLRVLVTDCCAKRQPIIVHDPRAPQAGGDDQDIGDIAIEKQPTLEALLLEHIGEVDINACTPPKESAWYTEDTYGGLFSYVFTDLAQRRSILTWNNAREYLDQETQKEFGKLFRKAETGDTDLSKPNENKIKEQGKQVPLFVMSDDLRKVETKSTDKTTPK